MLFKHSKAFSKGDRDVGEMRNYKYHIGIEDNTPVYIKPRHFNREMSEKIEEEVQRLTDL